jgi:serine/threonine protein kinase
MTTWKPQFSSNFYQKITNCGALCNVCGINNSPVEQVYCRKREMSLRNTILSGFSGCKLEIIQTADRVIVKKTSANKEYNDRLEKQSIKQSVFSSQIFYPVKIYKKGYDENGLFFLNMEYISGITMANYMKTISLCEITKIADIFTSLIPIRFDYDRAAGSIFKNKILSLEKHICGINNEIIFNSYNLLKMFRWKYVIKSSCHGDFTLENMLIADNKIYLFDFLDSFYDSWMIDYAKLLQDLDLYWSYRSEKNINNNLLVRLFILRDALVDFVLRLNDGECIIETLYYILLLNVLRILPYANENSTKKWISEKVKYILTKIQSRQWRL